MMGVERQSLKRREPGGTLSVRWTATPPLAPPAGSEAVRKIGRSRQAELSGPPGRRSLLSSMMPGPGVEPGRAEAQRILSPLRLPISPPRRVIVTATTYGHLGPVRLAHSVTTPVTNGCQKSPVRFHTTSLPRAYGRGQPSPRGTRRRRSARGPRAGGRMSSR